jgi:hypothetical protein
VIPVALIALLLATALLWAWASSARWSRRMATELVGLVFLPLELAVAIVRALLMVVGHLAGGRSARDG